MKQFSEGALKRRFGGGATPGPRGGGSRLAPGGKKKAGSMFKRPSAPGRQFKGLYSNKNPR